MFRFSILWYVNSYGRLLAPGGPEHMRGTGGEFTTAQILSGAVLSQASQGAHTQSNRFFVGHFRIRVFPLKFLHLDIFLRRTHKFLFRKQNSETINNCQSVTKSRSLDIRSSSESNLYGTYFVFPE